METMKTTESTESVRKSVRSGGSSKSREPNHFKEDFAKIGKKAPEDWGKCGSAAK